MYCYHAYHSVSLENNSYRPCCYANRSGLSTEQYNIIEFHQSNYMKKMRATMERGEWPKDCRRCKFIEEQGLSSLRTEAAQTTPDENIVDPQIKFLNLQFDNKCNLGCRMCWPNQSSILAAEVGLKKDFKTDRSLDLDFTKFQDLETLYMIGGETLLVKDNYKLLQKIIDLGISKKIEFSTSTNCTIYSESFATLIKEYKKVSINLSIDGIGKVQEYIRWPSKWEEMKVVFDKWIELEKQYENINVFINPTIQLLNAPYLDEFINYFSDYIEKMHCNVVEDPFFLNLAYAPDHIWELIDKQKLEHPEIKHIIEQKRNNRKENLFKQAKDYLQLQDKKRKINLEDYEPYFGFLRDAEI